MKHVRQFLEYLMHVDVELYLEKHPVVVDVKDANLFDLPATVDDEAGNATYIHVSEFKRVFNDRPSDAAVRVKARICES